MPKMSIYIPDELLEQARKLNVDSENTSKLIQRGLERMVEEQTRAPSYARVPNESHELIAEVRDRLLEKAREEYELGYTAAVDAASEMPLRAINDLADKNFDLETWLKPWVDGRRFELVNMPGTTKTSHSPEDVAELGQQLKILAEARKATPPGDWTTSSFTRYLARKRPWWWLERTAEAIGSMADPIGSDEYSFTPTQPRVRGYLDAMRELWSAVEDPGHSRPDPRDKLGDGAARNGDGGGDADPEDEEPNDS